jgi:hypothetical protein
MKGWVEGTLPGLVMQQSINDETYDVGETGACQSLNVGNRSGAQWGSDGDGSASLTSLTVAALEGVSIQPATVVTATSMNLPLSFSRLEVTGRYAMAQPCVMYDFGKKTGSTSPVRDNGSVRQTVSQSTLTFVVTLSDTVTASTVSIGAVPAVSVTPDSGGLPSWMVTLGELLSHYNPATAMRSSLEQGFSEAEFTSAMIAVLNTQLGG